MKDTCSKEAPPLETVEEGHCVACLRWQELSLEGRTG
jgi:hypothetical protein